MTILSESQIRQAMPRDKAYKLYDSRGLYLMVSTSGAKLWRFKYHFGPAERLLVIGKYPDVTLQRARDKRDAARRALADGIDPAIQKQAIAIVLFITAAVLAVATISNDNLQDLKTGQLVGATPWRQQVALIFGSIIGALVIPPVLDLVYQAYGFAGAPMAHAGMDPARALPAPQATLMAALTTGILSGKIDWTMMIIGAGTGALLILIDEGLKRRGGVARLPPLAAGLGMYLPSDVTLPLVVGGILVWLSDRRLRQRAAAASIPFEAYAEIPRRRGVLLASGLIVGESIFGVILAAIIVATDNQSPLALVGKGFAPIATALGGVAFFLVCADIYRRIIQSTRVAASE